METVLSILALPIFLAIFAIPFALIAAGIASGTDKWGSEDQAQFEHFNPRVKPVCDVHRIEPTTVQPTRTTVTVAKAPETAAVSSDDPDKIILVSSVMIKTPY